MYGLYVCPLNARAGSFFLLKQGLLESWAPNCEIIPAIRLFFKSQNGTTANGYYGFESPLPNVISKLGHYWGCSISLAGQTLYPTRRERKVWSSSHMSLVSLVLEFLGPVIGFK